MDFDEPELKYGSLTIIQLREQSKKRGAKLSGRKKDLVERLDAYERNFNFGKNQQSDIAEYSMPTPDESSYKDLHSGQTVPTITMENIETYLEPLNKTLGKESINLVNDRFLRYIKISTSSDEVLFVKSQCWAEMRKKVKYNIDVSVDVNGLIVECQCECGSGMGPEAHCKHVNAVLYALFKFSTTRIVISEETCTQRLQTFHHAAKHQGSPVKASDLKLPRRQKCDSESRPTKPLNFDPRPIKYRKVASNQSHFRSTCLNFPDVGRLPISQIYIPANTYAIAVDHDYTKENPEQAFLRTVELTLISDHRILEIEKTTRGQSASKEWINIRCFRLNSSSFGRICKLTDRTDKARYADSLTIYKDIKAASIKHGRKHEKLAVNKFQTQSSLTVTRCGTDKARYADSLTIYKDIKAASIKHGRKHEKLAVNKFQTQSRLTVTRCGTCVCKKCPYIAASPDGLIGDHATLEVKCPFASKEKFITHATVPYLVLDSDDSLTLGRSHEYYFQIQGQLLCTGREECYFCVYTHKDFKIMKIRKDEEFIKEMMVKLQAFYDDYFRRAVLEIFFYRSYRKFSFY